jgi:hypothetical protein
MGAWGPNARAQTPCVTSLHWPLLPLLHPCTHGVLVQRRWRTSSGGSGSGCGCAARSACTRADATRPGYVAVEEEAEEEAEEVEEEAEEVEEEEAEEERRATSSCSDTERSSVRRCSSDACTTCHTHTMLLSASGVAHLWPGR